MGCGLDVPAIGPRSGSMIRHALSSSGSREVGSPPSAVLRRAPTSASRPGALRFLRLPAPHSRSRFLSRSRVNASGASRVWSAGPVTGSLGVEGADSPRFLGSPSACMPSSQTPAGPLHQAFAVRRCRLPPTPRRRLPRCATFGAPSHSLHARCLRFAARGRPRTTQDSLPVGGQP